MGVGAENTDCFIRKQKLVFGQMISYIVQSCCGEQYLHLSNLTLYMKQNKYGSLCVSPFGDFAQRWFRMEHRPHLNEFFG